MNHFVEISQACKRRNSKFI